MDGEAPGRRASARRLAALRESGLSAAGDPGMERFARLVSAVIAVPVALVSLVELDRQVLPGFVGLDEPWASARWTPLSHSLSGHVVETGEPLVLSDTRDHPAATDLGVVAYAGMPLVDAEGNVLGALCAVDTRPRDWTATELGLLTDLAEACTAELRLRIMSHRSARAQRVAETAGKRSDERGDQARSSLAQLQLLLRAAQALATTTGLADVRAQVNDLVTSDMKPAYVGLILLDGHHMNRVVDFGGPTPVERDHGHYDLADDWPSARAARENTTIVIRGTADLVDGGYDPLTVATFEEMGLHTAICVPLPGPRGPLGTLIVAWDTDHAIDPVEHVVITALAGYTARAVERALFVDHRISVARQLQEAMLTTLPTVDGLDLAALYRPSAAGDLVGGDWYDAYPLPAPADATLAITIGDISGHDIHAATLMGQVRSMLRQADLDHPHHGPAGAVTALDHANRALALSASGTLVHAHLRRLDTGSWTLTWTNAGHPPPLLRHPDGHITHLTPHDMLLQPYLQPDPRTQHHTTLPPGSTLLLYTDGLIEHRDHGLDTYIAATATHLSTTPPDTPLRTLLTTIADHVAGTHPTDDIALIALRVHPA